MSDQIKSTHPTLILVRGLPGSGKSHLTYALERSFGEDAVVLDPDATDYESNEYLEHVKEMEADGVDPKLYAYRFLRAKAYQGIADHKIIIWNQPFTNLEIFNKMVGRLNDCARSNNTSLPILVVEVQLDPKAAKKRVEQRKQSGGHGPSDQAFERFANDYRSFEAEGYNTLTIYGDNDTNESVSLVKTALDSLA